MPVEASVDAHGESLTSLPGTAERRPYQAYCVTEASSRAQSPDLLIPRPLRIRPCGAQDSVGDADSQLLRRVASDNSFSHSAASSPERPDSLAILLKTGTKIKRQRSPSNGILSFGDTLSANPYHIAQAVAPRGSHSLASVDETVYDETPSHPRMQLPLLLGLTTRQKVNRKPVPWHNKHVGMDYHPLPALPFEAIADQGLGNSNFDPQIEGLGKEELEQTSRQTQIPCGNGREREEQSFPHRRNDSDKPIHPPLVINRDDPPRPLRRSVTFQDELEHLKVTAPPHDACFRDPSKTSQRRDLLDQHAQFPSSAALYTSRDRLLDTNDERTAHRRTRPKDAKLRYQFGQLPSRDFNFPPPTPPHRELHLQPDLDYSIRRTPSPSLHSSTDTQGGPRPPPWGSYDSLEMQRRRRGDARERAQARVYRSQMNGTSSLYRVSPSTDSFGKDVMRREVEGFREQVLSLYPELEFDGDANMGARGCCECCIVM